MLGGDLRCEIPLHRVLLLFDHAHLVHLERLGSLSEDTVRLYVAEISSALSFLHEKRIMHRSVTYN